MLRSRSGAKPSPGPGTPPSRHHGQPGQTMNTDDAPADFTKLDDPAFLAERARLRARLEHVPDNAVSREGLERLYEAMNREFDRRATAAWTAAS